MSNLHDHFVSIAVLTSILLSSSFGMHKFMGFYSVSNPSDLSGGWANSFYSSNHLALVEAHVKIGLDQQLIYLEPDFVTWSANGSRLVLVENWRDIITRRAHVWQELLGNGTVVGFFLGDELMWNGLSYVQLTEWSSALRAIFPSSFIWENEAYPVYSCDPSAPQPQTCPEKFGPCCSYGQIPINITNGIPPGLNVTSVDIYRWDPEAGPIVPKVKAYYSSYLIPRLHSGQRLFVVPGADASNHNPACNASCYDSMCAGDAASFAEWIQSDAVIAGAMPWSWDSCGSGCIPSLDEIGCKHMNATRQAWAAQGREIVLLPY